MSSKRWAWWGWVALAAGAVGARGEDPSFERLILENTAGDCKMVGDINGDGFKDGVLAGSPGEGLRWYRYPDWAWTVVAMPQVEFTTDGELGDVDGDGDLDVIMPDGPSGNNLLWFDNPGGSQSLVPDSWVRRTIGSLGSWGKDVEPADFDGDGRLDVGVRTGSTAFVFFRNANGGWQKVTIRDGLDGEGMTTGDLDRDGDRDVVLAGFWLRNPGGAGARTSAWTAHTIDAGLYVDVKAVVGDVNADAVPDVVFSNSEGTGAVAWYTPTSGDPTGPWTRRVVIASIDRAHTLQLGDMNSNGKQDLVVGQMHTSSARELAVYLNLNGTGLAWQKVSIDNLGMHNGVVADLGNDGDLDIFGANWTGNAPVRAYLNLTLDEGPCVADIDDGSGTGTPDGGVTVDDLLLYVAWFFEGDVRVDVDGGNFDGTPDGGVTIDDLLYYLARYEQGC